MVQLFLSQEDRSMRKLLAPLTVLIATVAVLSLGFARSNAQDKTKEKEPHHHHDSMFAKCAAACNDCQRECDSCATHCATMLSQGKKEHFKTLQTCQDCDT